MSFNNHGGAREGTGGHFVLSPERAAIRIEFEAEQARHERVKREAREYDLAQLRAQYLPREAQQAAAATVLAVLTHSLRAIPGRLESLGLGAEVAKETAAQIDDALVEVAAAFDRMTE
jgi:hypothetical protein